ncbi:MAG: hypothetical protein H6659_16790, partial [Ardenticatenaceae bacterium]|nr:hypothetical protein [Ardenticatenaceae bacterium]
MEIRDFRQRDLQSPVSSLSLPTPTPMRPLTAVDILTIWEKGQELHPLDRAMLLLTFAL